MYELWSITILDTSDEYIPSQWSDTFKNHFTSISYKSDPLTILLCFDVYGATADAFTHPGVGQHLDTVVSEFL